MYETVRAIRVLIDASGNPIMTIAPDGRYSIVFMCNDGKSYQVKFNTMSSKGNQKELITHFIGMQMRAPVLSGKLVQIPKVILEKTIALISSREEGGIIENQPDQAFYTTGTLFGIEWISISKNAESENDVKELYDVCKNKKSFFAIYPFDQYLRNYDRHYANHLFFKVEGDKKPTHLYAAIDGDRIFGCTSWKMLNAERHRYDCFSETFHKDLYSIVDNKTIDEVKKYTVHIEQISNEALFELFEILNQLYVDTQDEHAKIHEILVDRKSKILAKCDGSCFQNVRKRVLIS